MNMDDTNILRIYDGGVDDYDTNYDEDSDYDNREDENSDDYYDSDYYNYFDYDDYLPSDRHWEEDDSDWESDWESNNWNEKASSSESLSCRNLPEPEEVDVCKEISIIESSSISFDDKNAVTEKLKSLASNITCVVCLANKIQILCEPCGHFVMCGRCLQGLQTTHKEDSNCPLCRTKIEKTIIVTLP
ncbi:IAP repeat-containing protein 7-B [Armadillidium vulgare iridescent virus]|uniref:IAP repeat-containing protein 7-B n=1 Tax=Armadillidium vulgare iridescent virus TaxID=72201 RepID=A0A068QKS0_9VIRU|nr:IAP repeat-containing protein 7-B [Armadillidium vulgare iridescent virus]CCV02438.1 IAP repeat-containing protein 7-B [Armadillidium vulgare iridescent virus]